jgi:hypothetical protein
VDFSSQAHEEFAETMRRVIHHNSASVERVPQAQSINSAPDMLDETFSNDFFQACENL